MSFTPFLPKPSPHTICSIYCQEYTSLLPKELVTTQYSFSKKCDTFDRPTKARTWLTGVTSQDHPDYTQLIWSSSIKIHIIDSQKLNYLKHKAIAFGRTSICWYQTLCSLCRGILICFRVSEPNPLFCMQRPSWYTD